MNTTEHNIFPNRLCPDLWNDKGDLHPEVKEKLIEIGERFYNYLHIDAPLIDILFTGSLANFNWTEYSDIDLHIIIDFDQVNIGTPELTRNFFLSKKNVWNDKRDIRIYNWPLELGAQHIQEHHASTGQYSLLKEDDWVYFPQPITKQINEPKFIKLVSLFESLIDEVAVIIDPETRFNQAVSLKDNIIKLRRKSIEHDGEISIGNQTFKQLRNNSSLNRLFGIISSSLDKRLSLSEQRITDQELLLEKISGEKKIRELVRKELLPILSLNTLVQTNSIYN